MGAKFHPYTFLIPLWMSHGLPPWLLALKAPGLPMAVPMAVQPRATHSQVQLKAAEGYCSGRLAPRLKRHRVPISDVLVGLCWNPFVGFVGKQLLAGWLLWSMIRIQICAGRIEFLQSHMTLRAVGAGSDGSHCHSAYEVYTHMLSSLSLCAMCLGGLRGWNKLQCVGRMSAIHK